MTKQQNININRSMHKAQSFRQKAMNKLKHRKYNDAAFLFGLEARELDKISDILKEL